MKRILLSLLAITIVVAAFSDNLTEETAQLKAQEFLRSHNASSIRSSQFANEELQSQKLSPNCVMVSSQKQFVLVTGEEEQPQISGYGESETSQMPEALAVALRQIAAPTSTVQTNILWAAQDGYKLPIAPIVGSVRHQEAPFNALCPYYIYDDGFVSSERCVVGCVATAAEQVVSHWRHPQTLQDTIKGFFSPNVGQIEDIAKGTPIDFANILNHYTEGAYSQAQAKAVAELSYYLGVACQMDWGPSSSGANLRKLVKPLSQAFGYEYVRRVASYDYTPRKWFGLLLKELEASRPIVYAGYTSHGGGHAFVVDGINSEGYFHITWGYGGNYDGYFDLNVLTPQENPLEPSKEGTVYGLCHMQEALFMHPDPVEYDTIGELEPQHRIEIDTVIFLRQPDTNKYLEAEVKVRNTSQDDIYAPVEFFTYSEVDTTGFPTDIDYLGVADGTLKAQTDTTFSAYLQFSVAGERILGLNTPDSLYLNLMPLSIKKAYQPTLNLTLLEPQITSSSISFKLDIENTSATYWSGRMLTYSIFEGPYSEAEGDWRHFTVLNLAPKATMQDQIEFKHLQPQKDYTLVIRNPWQPAITYPFTTPKEITGLSPIQSSAPHNKEEIEINHRIRLIYNPKTNRYHKVLKTR